MPTLALLGDVMLGRKVREVIARRPPEWCWGSVLPILQSSDAVIANLECAITEHTDPWQKTPKLFHFRADPRAVEVLQAGNVRCVSLANNHVLDFRQQGLFDTLTHLDAAGIQHVGAGRQLAEAASPVIVDAGGVKIGVLALTDNEPAFAAGTARPGTHYAPIPPTSGALARLRRAMARARKEDADLLLLSVHWGPNLVKTPPDRFRAFARSVVRHGVDIVHGHSAHVFQGVQQFRQRPLLYDTGDFISDYAVNSELRNDWSFVFLLEVDAEGPVRLRMVPVRLRGGRVDLAEGAEFHAIRDRMRSLCAALGTRVTDTPEGLETILRHPEGVGASSTNQGARYGTDRDST